MAAPRKIFRIEETPAARLAADGAEALRRQALQHQASQHQASPHQASQRHSEVVQAQILQELAALRAAFAPPLPSKDDISGAPTGRLENELNFIADRLAGGEGDDGAAAETVPLTRIANELLAVTHGTEQATQKILGAAEEIDQLANSLSATLKGKIEQGLAQDIQDLVIRIFEACNFQDLSGQRISKVMTTLTFIEEHVTQVLDEIKNMSTRPSGDAAQYLHGPRLDDDSGHVSQVDIDALFHN